MGGGLRWGRYCASKRQEVGDDYFLLFLGLGGGMLPLQGEFWGGGLGVVVCVLRGICGLNGVWVGQEWLDEGCLALKH
jgi:hypothetical protein